MKRLTSLELFILSCVDRGLETPYDLLRRAGLSLGATNPALKRLLKAGMLKRATGSTDTNRPRHAYSLGAEGERAARKGWKDFLDDPIPPTDLDSLLRILDMAIHNKASKSTLVEFLARAAEARRHAAELLRVAAGQHAGDRDTFSYPRLRAEFEKERLLSELSAFGQILTRLKKKRPERVQASL